MIITICGSMSFAKEMLSAAQILTEAGHVCHLPDGVHEYAAGTYTKIGGSEGAKRKIKFDLIKRHYSLIQQSDAIVVLNYSKNNVSNYIGGNAFLEMGFAHVLGKKIFVLNPLPENVSIGQELEAMQPILLHGDITKIS